MATLSSSPEESSMATPSSPPEESFMAIPSSSPEESSMETSTLPQNYTKKQFWDTVLFWIERALILELILYAFFRFDYPPTYLSYLCVHHGIATNFFYAAAFVYHQFNQPFSFEPDFIFYLERVGFLFAVLKGLGYMEKGLDYGVDILVTIQLYMIMEFLFDLGCYLKKKYYDIEDSKIKPIVETARSKVYQEAIGPCYDYCKKQLLSFWDSYFVPVNEKDNKVRKSRKRRKSKKRKLQEEDDENKDESEGKEEEEKTDKVKVAAEEVNEPESDEGKEVNSPSKEESKSPEEVNEDEYDELKELRRNIKHYRAAEILYNAQKSYLLAENNRLQRNLNILANKPELIPIPPSPFYLPQTHQWGGDQEKAMLNKRIQNQEAEKKELLDKYYKLVQEKGSVEVELGFQKSLVSQYKAGMEEFEGKFMEQREKNLKLAGKYSAELWMVNKMCDENGELVGKYRNLEEERCHLMAELAAAKSAYEYYKSSS